MISCQSIELKVVYRQYKDS